MIRNPFTPATIAASPDDFFGRVEELADLERSLPQGSVVIQGPVGIGKSSLLARSRLLMEGFDSEHKCETVVAVGDRDVTNVDQAARLLLECFTDVDEKHNKVKFSLGSVIEFESADLCKYFAEGRHLAALKRILQRANLERLLSGKQLLILGVDEADKCPAPLARLFRSLTTHTQQNGIYNVRFLFAGVSPFMEYMAREDPGVSRFVYRTITLAPMDLHEAEELIESKFERLAYEANHEDNSIEIHPDVISRIVRLSGGHPHILQLLGSHVVEHEIGDPDGIIDARDLHGSLRRICYEDRVAVYETTIHHLSSEDKYDSFLALLGMTPESPVNICSKGFPTRIDAELARSIVSVEQLDWLVRNNILRYDEDVYGLIDEFLRIRITFDLDERESRAAEAAANRGIDDVGDYTRGTIDTRLLDDIETDING